MPTASRAAAAPKPTSQASRYGRQQAAAAQARVAAVAGIVAAYVVPLLPSPIGPFPNPLAAVPGFAPELGPWDWRGYLWGTLAPSLLQPIIPAGLLGFPHPALTPFLAIQLGGAIFGLLVILGLIQHLISLYAQRTTPLAATHTYVRLRIPGSARLTPLEGVTLFRTLHGMLPPANLAQGSPVPLTLRWTARPEMPVTQGVTICGQPTLLTSISKTLEGLTRGAAAEVADDPFVAELREGRWLCWADVRQVAPRFLPIAVAGRSDDPLLDALLPAMSPQAGVDMADVQIMLSPLSDRTWRLPVLAQQEALKLDIATPERQALDAKAAGPAFRVGVRLRVIAESRDAGVAMVQTIAATLSSSAQPVAGSVQRLSAGGAQALPATLPPAPALPPLALRVVFGAGAVLALAVAVGCWLWAAAGPLTWALPILALPIPALAVGCWHRRQIKADMRLVHASVVGAILPPANPKLVPLIGPWLGRSE
ncbi:hypothetical protein EKD04_017940 [Chloroflexales bacterium ZM16-3]|nr:hypothetical protein [Chloroflexales bacterium ZM16-3]